VYFCPITLTSEGFAGLAGLAGLAGPAGLKVLAERTGPAGFALGMTTILLGFVSVAGRVY
jgi:hypothetical protein